jgi:CheY-like chemotaxis protein
MATKILVIDDDINICDLLRMYLEKEGYEVRTANDGIEAMSAFRAYEPDLVLLDIMLPKKDGWQICREIREQSSKPVIMISAKGETIDKVLGLELGADDYIVKPLDMKEGAEIVVELTSAAYYNDGSNGANNLCFNFLASPDSYKSMSDGISIIIWLYPTESNVQIMNYTDTALASGAIATPLDGGTITISVKHEEYYSFVEDTTYWAYVIRVNEAEIVLTKEVLTSNGHDMPDEVYFSMGSFADNKENPNILTLVSANGVEFGLPSEEPECTDHIDEDADGKCDNCGADVEVQKPTDPTDPDTGDQEVELNFFQKLANFFKGIVDAIKNFFIGLIGKVS